jgi:hypothetical protein
MIAANIEAALHDAAQQARQAGNPAMREWDPPLPGGAASAPPQTLAPAEALRRRLTDGRDRLLVVLATSLVWVMDALLMRRLEAHHLVAGTYHTVPVFLERLSTLAFIVVTIGMALALYRSKLQSFFYWILGYLVIAMMQVVSNVASMVVTTSAIKGGGLSSLWDVAAVYAESVVVFMFIYVFLDVVTPGGAFVWPSRDGEPAPVPHLIDYLFISLNVNSTYGPTSEVLISRSAKLFMALQVLLAMVMLTVLIARAVSA